MTVVVVIVASALAVAAAVAWGVQHQRRASLLEQALARFGEVLAAGQDREALLTVVLDTALAMTGARGAVLWLDTGAALVARMVRGDAGVAEGDRVGPDAMPDCTMSATLLPRNRLYGVVCVYGGSLNRAADLAALASHAARAIETTYAFEEAKHLSITDGLTGLWNRRQFDVRCVEELDRSARYGEAFAVVLADIDDFKKVNDTYGHPAGDTVLVEVAKRLVENTRGVDLVARYGGEEFGLVLPRTSLEGALRVADHVRKAVAGLPVETDAGALTVSLSIGVACHPDHGDSIPALTAAADAALYAAKQAGKNRVLSAPVTETT